MKTKITQMTAEQAAYLPIYCAEWIRNGESTERNEPSRIRDAITALYAATNLDAPKIIVMDSPLGCLVARTLMNGAGAEGDNLWDNLGDNLWANLWDNLWDNLGDNLWDNLGDNLRANLWDNLWANLWDNLRANLRDNLRANLWDNLWDNLGDNLWDNLGANLRDNLRDNLGANLGDNLRANLWDNLRAKNIFESASLWGQHDVGWLAFCDFSQTLGHKYPDELAAQLSATINYSKLCGWLYAYNGIAFVSQKQCELHRDQVGRLHSDSRMAMAFADGYGFYAWHGIRVPAWCIEDKQKITRETILGEDNTEIRRAMCEIVGWPKAMEMFGGKQIHSDECLGLPRKLIEISLKGERVRLLLMTNGTVENGERRQFVEGIPNTINTCHEAVAWQCGLPVNVYNEGVRT